MTASPQIRLYCFTCGHCRSLMQYVTQNENHGVVKDVPIPFFLITHPAGNVLVDGGNPIEVAIDKHAHWGGMVEGFDPTMTREDHVVEQIRRVGVEPASIRYVVQSHLHVDHVGAIGHFPDATFLVQRVEHRYAYTPDWFAAESYIRSDFDKPDVDWQFLEGADDDFYDVLGDGSVRCVFTPGHSPGHMSVVVELPNSGTVVIAVDAAFMRAHFRHEALPGLVDSASELVRSVDKLRRIAQRTDALVIPGHDHEMASFVRMAPAYYD